MRRNPKPSDFEAIPVRRATDATCIICFDCNFKLGQGQAWNQNTTLSKSKRNHENEFGHRVALCRIQRKQRGNPRSRKVISLYKLMPASRVAKLSDSEAISEALSRGWPSIIIKGVSERLYAKSARKYLLHMAKRRLNPKSYSRRKRPALRKRRR